MISNNTCPPGVICINNTNAIGMIAVFLIVIYVINKENYKSLYEKVNFLQNRQNNHAQGMIMAPEQSDYNMEVIKNPLYPPLKRNYHLEHEVDNLQNRLNLNMNTRKSATERQEHVMETPNAKGLPINIETRGSGGDFQQMGMLYKNNISDDSKAPGNNTDNNVLPLYGKPTYRGSNKFCFN